jgi:inorganic phosphate transporter, PiT family
VAVAKTIGDEIAETGVLTLHVITACLISAIVWNLATWFMGIPSSSSHALIGGLVGAIAMGAGFSAIKLSGLEKVLIALFTSPIIGFALGFVLLRIILFLARGATPGINEFFKRAQLVTALVMSFSHGTNDAQKTMGIITLSLVIGGVLPEFTVPSGSLQPAQGRLRWGLRWAAGG